MTILNRENQWVPGSTPVTVVMISLNEAHNMREVLENMKGFAQDVILVDSYSVDDTVSIALEYRVRVVQRKFCGFGDQWNFAINELPIDTPWTMKIDPDERLSDALKENIHLAISKNQVDGFSFERRLWFMGKILPVRQEILRIWRTGKCHFTDVAVNEYPLVAGRTEFLPGIMEHRDSPDLDHWLEKQNRYTTAEAIASYTRANLADIPKLFGTSFQRRMWLKRNFDLFPLRYKAIFLYNYLVLGAFKAGWPGYAWARMRVEVMRMREYKSREMRIIGGVPSQRYYGTGLPDPRVPQIKSKVSQLATNIPRGATFHESLAVKWTDKYQSGGFAKRITRIHEFLRSQVKADSVWLDAGCGSGILSNEIASLGARVVAVDASPQMIEIASTAPFPARDRLDFRLIGSIESMPFSNEFFDGGVCSSVLEYVDNPDQAISELLRVLKPGGHLLITVVNQKSLVRRIQKVARCLFSYIRVSIFEYLEFSVNEYYENNLISDLEGRGFRIISCEHFDPILPDIAIIRPYFSLFIFHIVST